MGRDVDLSFYRTRSGMEVDLLVEGSAGVLAVEVKLRDRAVRRDARGLRSLAAALGPRWRGGIVVHRGALLEELDADSRIWSVPAHRLLT